MTESSPYAAAIQAAPGREHAVEVLGAATRYWEYGTAGEAGTIVAVHGFRGDHHGLEPIVACLAGHHVVAPDLPGFGASDPLREGPHDLAGYVAWLRAFVSGLRLAGPVTLLGHSFGSIVVAAALAESGPRIVPEPARVVLVNPIGAPALQGPRGIGTAVAVAYYRLGAALPERAGLGLLRNRMIVRSMSQAMAKTRDRALRAWIHDQHDRYFSVFAGRGPLLEAFRASVSHDVSEFAARIPQPVLLIAGERDDITSVADEERLATLFPHAVLHVIPGVGHLIHYETPQAAADLTARFVAEAAG